MKTETAVRYFGSKNKLATALGITRAAVSNWQDEVPMRRAYEIERLTGGKLKAPSLPNYSVQNGMSEQGASK